MLGNHTKYQFLKLKVSFWIILRSNCKELCEINCSWHCLFPFIGLLSPSFGERPLESQNHSGCRGFGMPCSKQVNNWIQSILGALSRLILKGNWALKLMNCTFCFGVIGKFDGAPFCFQLIYKDIKQTKSQNKPWGISPLTSLQAE